MVSTPFLTPARLPETPHTACMGRPVLGWVMPATAVGTISRSRCAAACSVTYLQNACWSLFVFFASESFASAAKAAGVKRIASAKPAPTFPFSTLRLTSAFTVDVGIERLLRGRSEEKRFVIQEHSFRFRRFRMIELHLDHEAADVGPENWMDGMFFSREYLLHRAHLPAQNHVQVAVIDGRARGSAALIVVGHKSEVHGGSSRDAQIVRRLLGRGDRLFEPSDLFCFF